MAKHALGVFKNVGVSAEYSAQNTNHPLETLIYRALGSVIAAHPILTAIPIDEDTPSPYYVRIPYLDLRQCVTFVSSKSDVESNNSSNNVELDALLEREHNTDFKARSGELPFWRVVVLYSPSTFTVAFIFHHAISDGTSGLAFHRHLLSALQDVLLAPEPLENDASDLIHIIRAPESPLLPSLESVHELPFSREHLLRVSNKEKLPGAPTNTWTGSQCSDSPDLSTSRFQSFTMSPTTTQKLVTASRKNSTTITGLIDAIIAAALFANLPKEYDSLRSDGAISFRRHLPHHIVDENSLGTWTSRYVVDHARAADGDSVSPDDAPDLALWDEARRIRKIIQSVLEKDGADSSVGLLRYVKDCSAMNKKKLGKPRAESFESSNIGVFKQNGRTEVCRVGRMVFSQSADIVGAAFEASIVTGGDGSMTIGISWLDGPIDSQWMIQLIGSLRASLERLAIL